MIKVTDEIYQVGGNSLTSPQDAAVYLINFDGRAALIDAGCGFSHNRLMSNIHECGVTDDQIEYLLITHCHFDHTGGINAIKKSTGCRVAAHQYDAVFLEKADQDVTAAGWYNASIEPVQIDIRWSGGHNNIVLKNRAIKAIHIPGHSPGSLVFLTESEGLTILFGQDVHGPLDEILLSNRDDYIRSLNLMLSLNADILCEGHFGIYKGKDNVKGFIRSFL